MQEFPHHYRVTAVGGVQDDVELTADGVPRLRSASPAEFGGPGDRWSPETMLVGAVADCFVLAFRAVAQASKVPWTSLRCEAERGCLISNSLKAVVHLEPGVDVVAEPVDALVGGAR